MLREPFIALRGLRDQGFPLLALGRRINNTKEIHDARLPANVLAVIKYRKAEDGTFLSLTPDAEEVLKEEGLILGDIQ